MPEAGLTQDLINSYQTACFHLAALWVWGTLWRDTGRLPVRTCLRAGDFVFNNGELEDGIMVDRRFFAFSCGVMAGLALAIPALANTIHVPAGQPTIQAGIDAASNGDVVLVAPGTYAEAVNFNGKAITVASTDGAAVTIIDATGLDASVVKLTSNLDAGVSSVLRGFELTGGRGSHGSGGSAHIRFGGGVHISGNGDSQVLDCVIHGNSVDTVAGESSCNGGGVYISTNAAGSPTVLLQNCQIFENTAMGGSSGGAGGGVAGGTTVHFVDCTIKQNKSSWVGGGLELGTSSTFTFLNCRIEGNETGGGTNAGGAGLRAISSSVTMVNTSIVRNVTHATTSILPNTSGFLAVCTPPTLINCTIADNVIEGPLAADAAGGVYYVVPSQGCGSGSLTMRNTVVYGNTGAEIGGPAPKSVQYSCVEGGFAGTGNTSASPAFVDPADGDYRLAPASPCRDAGDRSFLPADAFDLDADMNALETLSRDAAGFRRIVNGQVDIGAYEWQRSCSADVSPSSPGIAGDGVTDIDDLFVVINGWGPCDQCVADVNGDDQADIDDLFLVINAWGPCP